MIGVRACGRSAALPPALRYNAAMLGSELLGAGCLIEAAVMLWTAGRVQAGKARHLPEAAVHVL